MIDIISAFDIVLGMRMHSLIFAAIAGTPFAAISRVDKVDNFMKLFCLHASGTVGHCDSAGIICDLERLLEKAPVFHGQMARRIAMLRQECRQNTALFQRLMSERKSYRHKVSLYSLGFALLGRKYFSRISQLLRGDITLAQVLRKLGKVCGYNSMNGRDYR